MTPDEFIDRFEDLSILTTEGTNLFPSVKIAMAMIESNYGDSTLATTANNYFGIKAYTNPNNVDVVYMNDDVAGEPFRKYETITQGWKDHTDFLNLQNPRYKTAMLATTPEDQITEIMKAGYATSQYSDLAITLINQHGLKEIDKKKAS